jgi:membrane dipeptidase
VAKNGGVVLVNLSSGFVVLEAARQAADTRRDLRAKYRDPAAYAKALAT